MVHYKLTYFAFNGLGENCRQLFALANVDFEDDRVEVEDWPKVKPTTPFGQMPILEVEGKRIPQSKAIARYLARKFGFAGQTELEQAEVDAWGDQISDYIMETIFYFRYKTGFASGDPEAEFKNVVIPARERFFPIVVKQLKENGSGYLIGNKVTWADLYLNNHVETFMNFDAGYLDKYPEILAHLKKVRDIPALKKWIEKRPKHKY
ncbi:unnamed protein product, partial [Mesorhabditis spiculigera]